jgi:nitrite reductase/ring-hydroxylating ferredoxin subunit
MLTDVPIGSWTSAFFLDLFGGEAAEPAADTLVALGVVTALPTAAAGVADWSDTIGPDSRVGLVHALSNVAAVALYSLSWLARRRGDRGRGLALGYLGATVATVGGYLGGHLSYRRGVNVNRTAWLTAPSEWVRVAAADDVPVGEAVRVTADDVDVVLVHDGTQIHALADVCSHLGGPLHEGSLADGCISCPWHGSTFRLDDGTVVRGPATAPQPAFETRVSDGEVAVRLRR